MITMAKAIFALGLKITWVRSLQPYCQRWLKPLSIISALLCETNNQSVQLLPISDDMWRAAKKCTLHLFNDSWRVKITATFLVEDSYPCWSNLVYYEYDNIKKLFCRWIDEPAGQTGTVWRNCSGSGRQESHSLIMCQVFLQSLRHRWWLWLWIMMTMMISGRQESRSLIMCQVFLQSLRHRWARCKDECRQIVIVMLVTARKL